MIYEAKLAKTFHKIFYNLGPVIKWNTEFKINQQQISTKYQFTNKYYTNKN